MICVFACSRSNLKHILFKSTRTWKLKNKCKLKKINSDNHIIHKQNICTVVCIVFLLLQWIHWFATLNKILLLIVALISVIVVVISFCNIYRFLAKKIWIPHERLSIKYLYKWSVHIQPSDEEQFAKNFGEFLDKRDTIKRMVCFIMHLYVCEHIV